MKFKALTLLCISFFSVFSATNAQVGIGTSTPATSAQLDVSSTTKGFLAPRMSSANRTAISTPSEGLIVYQTDGTKGFYYYNGAAWTRLVEGPLSLDGLTDAKAGGANFTNGILIGSETTGTLSAANNNTGLGYATFWSLTQGDDNTGIGMSALTSNTTGNNNTAVGSYSLPMNTSGSDNTSVGQFSMYSNSTGTNNSAMGAGSLLSNSTGTYNTAAGFYSLALNSTGNYNTAVGYYALGSTNTKSYNTAIGNLAGYGSNYTNMTCIGNGSLVTGDNQVQLGNSYTTTYVYGTVQNRSDGRDKKDIRDTELGLDFILSLRPVDYHYDYRERYSPPKDDSTYLEPKNDGHLKNENYNHGFIAQEVQETAKEKGFEFGGVNNVADNGGKDVYYLGYSEFIAPLTKAIQEQHAVIKGQEQKINELTELVSKLAKRKRRK